MSIQKLITKSLITTFSIILFAGHVHAAQENGSGVYELGEIIVTPDMREGYPASSVYEIGAEEIMQKNAETVEEALEYIPGVRITVGAKNEPNVMIRGFEQERVLVLLDGIPIADPQYGYVDLNQIPVENISKIKVIKGAASTLYGSNAFGGVVNIITRQAGKKPEFEVEGAVSGDGSNSYAVNGGATIGDLNFWISASRRESDGYHLSNDFEDQRNETSDAYDNTYYDKMSLSMKAGFRLSQAHDMMFSLIHIDNEKGIPPQVNASRPRYWRFTDWKRDLFALTDEIRPTDRLTLRLRAFYDKYDNVIASYDDNTYTTQNAGSAWTSTYEEYATGAGVQFFYESGEKHSLRGGVNFKRDLHKERDDFGEDWEAYELRTYSLSLEDDFNVSDKLSLTLGSSLDVFSQEEAYQSSLGETERSLNPLGKLKFSLDEESLLYAAVSKKTRFPTLNHLYANTSGNPDLREQENINYELGLKKDFKEGFGLDASYFYNDVEDLIERASRNDPYYNVNKAVFRGIELLAHGRIKGFNTEVAYTYLDGIDRSPETLGRNDNELEYTPKHKADLRLRYDADFGLSCMLFGAYTGERYYYDSGGDQHSMGGYTLWDASLLKDFGSWKANLFARNIFDRNYSEEDGFPQPGRTITLRIKKEF